MIVRTPPEKENFGRVPENDVSFRTRPPVAALVPLKPAIFVTSLEGSVVSPPVTRRVLRLILVPAALVPMPLRPPKPKCWGVKEP